MRSIMVMALLCGSGNALAVEEQKPRIAVSGTGKVETPPDLVTIEFRIVGEGSTSDVALSALVAKRNTIDEGLATFGTAMPTASRVSITEVHGSGCKREDDDTLRLSTGACAVIGYVASIEMTVRTPGVKDAGTVVGLLGRFKATDPRIDGFGLADPQAAERRAITGALIDARCRAEAIAAGAGVKLGRLVAASTGVDRGDGAQDIVVTARRVAAPAMAMVPPIAVDLTPRPIETQAQVSVTYEIAP